MMRTWILREIECLSVTCHYPPAGSSRAESPALLKANPGPPTLEAEKGSAMKVHTLITDREVESEKGPKGKYGCVLSTYHMLNSAFTPTR